MKKIVTILIVITLLSGCISQKGSPKIAITAEDPPEELIVSDTVTFTLSLANEGDASAFNVTLESNIPALLTFETDEITEIAQGFTRTVDITIEGADILKEREFDIIDAILKVKYFDSENNQKTARTSFKVKLRKPVVVIDNVEAGILPGKIFCKENEKVPISVYIKNEDNKKMENLYIVFCSDYEHVSIYRLDIDTVGNCFAYQIMDVLWFNDLLAKGFTMEASLPPGAQEVSFVLTIKLVWKTGDYEIVLDNKELNVEVGV